MKYYNIDLTQFVPYGIPLNSTENVEYKNHINEFFLHGFERWYNQLFTTNATHTELISDYSRSCAAPYSLSACKYYTDNQLEKSIQDAGFVYYAANNHDINAKFVYDLARYPHRTKDYLTSIAQYISNNIDVDVELVYEGLAPYEYDLRIYGDILGSEDVSVMITRLLDHLTVLSTAHTQLRGIEFIETSPILNGNAACVGDNACIYYESIIRDFKNDKYRYITTYSAFKAPSACTYYESIIKEVKPEPETFDPNIPLYIENMSSVPVEVGLYNHSSSTHVRTNCKISYDNSTWQDYNLTRTTDPKDSTISKITLANKGDRVYIKADLTGAPSNSDYTHLTVLNESANTKIRARGNIASISKGTDDIYKTDYLTADSNCYYRMFGSCTSLTQAPELPATTLNNRCYASMFGGCASLTQAPELPATTLAGSCYSNMFNGCTSLTQAPVLPATTLASGCYNSMFYNCTSLTKAPDLPATTLASYCYSMMFYGCTSLTQAPELPATTLNNNCYANMFWGCRSLTQAPDLPAAVLANYCYFGMFSLCISLTQAPILPAKTLTDSCYQYMFYRCSSLNYVKCLATSISASGCTFSWLRDVSATGDFYKQASTNWTTGTNGIPSGWTRHNV